MAELAGPPRVRVGVLGPLHLLVGDEPVEVPGPKRQALLALLALAEGRAVAAETLLAALGSGESEAGRRSLHSHVSRLRGHLGDAAGRLRTLPGAYQLALEDDDLDASRARRMLSTARSRMHDDPASAGDLLRRARELWRGPPLAGLADAVPLAVAAAGLDELHRQITDLFVEATILVGEPDRVLDLSLRVLAEDPLREGAVRLRMRALAATGQAQRALSEGRGFRRRLAEEAGLDPTPGFGDLKRAIADAQAGASPATRPATAPAPRPPRAGPRPPQTAPRPPQAGPRPPRAGRLPHAATVLLGRQGELAALRRVVTSERLVTVVGPGGVGKTRLALESARSLDPLAVVPLAPVTDGHDVPFALASALGLEVTSGDPVAVAAEVLASRPGLVVVDNCEHLPDPVRDLVSALLASCPDLTVLATSRERLGLPAECAFRLAPLPVPAPDHPVQTLQQVPSVALFVDRAVRARPGFAPSPRELRVVADVVRRLDGVPLAIELAASRLSGLGLADLHQRLDRVLDLLTAGRASTEARHRTLRTALEWSYRLLADDQRRLLRHLAVFPDGVDLATAEFVADDLRCGGDPGVVLAHLVDASMLDATLDGNARYRMLETVRVFGISQLDAEGELEAARDRLVRWAVRLAEWIHEHGGGADEPDADAALRRELANLRSAWHACRRRGDRDAAAAIVVHLHDMADWRELIELRTWTEELANDPALAGHPREAAVLGCAAAVAYHRGDNVAAADRARAGLALAQDAEASRLCLGGLSLASFLQGAWAAAIDNALAASAIAQHPTESPGIAALAAAYSGDLDRARELNRRLRAQARNHTLRGLSVYAAAEINAIGGQPDAALQEYDEAITLAQEAGASFLGAVATVGRLALLARTGHPEQALAGFRDVINYFVRLGNWTQLWTTLHNLAELLRRLGDEEPAARISTCSPQAPGAPERARALDEASRAIERHLAMFRPRARPEG